MRRLAVAFAIVTLLAGCSSSSPAPAEQKMTPAVSSTSSATVDTMATREAVFLASLIPSARAQTPDKYMLIAGYGVCKALENGSIQISQVAGYAATTYAEAYGPGVGAAAMKAELLCPNWNKPSS